MSNTREDRCASLQALESRLLLTFPLLFGSSGIDLGSGVAGDSSGHVFVTGAFQKTVDFKPGSGTTNLTALGGGSTYVAKYNSSGSLLWARRLGSVTDPNVEPLLGISGRIAVDAQANSYTTGLFNSTSDFSPSTGVGGDAYVVKLDANGNIVWKIGFGSSGLDFGTGIALDASNNVFVTGGFSGTVDFDPSSAQFKLTSQGQEDIFLAKYTSAGKFKWARSIGGNGIETGTGVAVNQTTGQSYITGAMNSLTAGLSNGTTTTPNFLQQTAFSSAFVAKFSPAGSPSFAVKLGGTGSSISAGGLGIAVDPGSDIFVSGAFVGKTDFDPSGTTVNLTPVGGSDGFLTKLSGGEGHFLITKRVGGSGDDSLDDVHVTDTGFVFAAGLFRGSDATVSGAGTANLTSHGGYDHFISKFRVSGKFLGAKGFGGTGDDGAFSIGFDSSHDYVLFTGFLGATTDIVDFFDLVEIQSGGSTVVYRTTTSLSAV